MAAAPERQEHRPVPRYVSGALDGTFTFENWGTPDAVTNGDATGTLRHLGLARLYTEHQPNETDGTLRHGTFKIVAADGAFIWGKYEGAGFYDPNGDQVHSDAQFEIKGGTGRFAHARGTLNAVFLEAFDQYHNCSVAWTLEGIVSY